MDCKEVHFAHLHVLAINHDLLWDSYQTCHDLLVFAISHENMHLSHVSWSGTSPPELFLGVVESEVSNLILNIVIHEKFADFFHFIIIIHIKSAPLEAWRQSCGLTGDILRFELLDLPFFGCLFVLHDGLGIPKLVFIEDAQELHESIPLEKVDVRVVR